MTQFVTIRRGDKVLMQKETTFDNAEQAHLWAKGAAFVLDSFDIEVNCNDTGEVIRTLPANAMSSEEQT